MGEKLQAALKKEFGQHPHIGDIRGRGLFIGIEVVEDRETKKPFDPSKAINKALKKATFEAGLACYPMGGTIDGVNGDHILLAPPFIMEDEHVDEIITKLKIAIEEVL
jgi:adenosylmethionine-8-amino-7-oxononanoate aminotransferase